MRKFDETDLLYSHANYLYYGEQVSPRIEKVGHSMIAHPTSFRQVRTSTYAYVRGGNGFVEINGTKYPITRGSQISFLNYHLYRYIPDTTLEVSYCCLRNGSVCTFFNNPYFPHTIYKTLLDEADPVKQIQEESISTVEALWDAIENFGNTADTEIQEAQLYMMMEIIGYQFDGQLCAESAEDSP